MNRTAFQPLTGCGSATFFGPSRMGYRRLDHRIETLVLWFTASIAVTGALLYAARLDHGRRKPNPGFANPRPGQEPLALQEARAIERGRGRRAEAPLQIPWRGWKDILIR